MITLTRAPERRPRARLGAFAWDGLADLRARALRSGRPLVDLSLGVPVDPVPDVARQALHEASRIPGYPATHGSLALREAAAGWLARRLDVPGVDPVGILPCGGAKELLASLPLALGLGPGDTVAVPELAYPTYATAARLVGADVVPYDPTDVATLGANRPNLVVVNSPANPTGAVATAEELRVLVGYARAHGALLLSDECYIEFGWTTAPLSVLHPDVAGGSFENVLAVHSLSKRSNLAGFRAGFVAGDPAVVAELLAVRRHLGNTLSHPVQNAARAVLADDAHVDDQRRRYAGRRNLLLAALHEGGWQVDDSAAGVYLWVRRPAYDGRQAAEALADRGILAVPGRVYGPTGHDHVRLALTASDEAIADAAERLGPAGSER